MLQLQRIRDDNVERAGWARAIRADLFDRQLQLYDDPSRSKAAHPGRRSGKSELVPRAALLDVFKAGFEETIIIGAETQKKARALHWAKLARLVLRFDLPLRPNKSEGTWSTPWGATIVFWGVKDKGAVDLLRGFKLRSAYFDEVATYAPLLKYLTRDVVQPALSDTGGTLYLLGTPSVTRAGPWFEICNGDVAGWSVHHWTMLENKRFPRDPRDALFEVLQRNKWTEDNATYQREWLGRFVNDIEAQVYQYLASRNDVVGLPAHFDLATWLFVIGADFGTRNPCGWVVWGWHPHERDLYAVHAEKHRGLLTDQAAKVTGELCETYRPIGLVGDVGGLGKPYAEEWNQRYAGRNKNLEHPAPHEYAMPIMKAADKQGKFGHIRIMNGDLGTGRIHIVQDACKDYSDELATLPYYKLDVPDDQLKEHPGHENHLCDGGLYGYIETRTYLNEAPEPSLADRDPDDAAAWLEHLEAQEAAQRARGEDWERW